MQTTELSDLKSLPLRKSSVILDRLIFYGLLIVIALTAIPYGSVEPWWKALFECSIFSLGIVWSMKIILDPSSALKMPSLAYPVILFILYALIQGLPLWHVNLAGLAGDVSRSLSSDPYETKQVVFYLMALALLGFLLLGSISHTGRLRLLVNLLIGVGFLSAVFGLARQAMQHQAGFLLPYLRPGSGYGQFPNAGHFAFLMEMAVGLSLGLLTGRAVRLTQTPFYLLAAVVMWLATVLSSSRGGIASLLAQALFLSLMFSHLRPKDTEFLERYAARGSWHRISGWVLRVAVTACLMIGLVLSIIWVGGEPLAHRLEYAPNEFQANEVDEYRNTRRQKIWEATWQLIKDHPIAGVGMGGYWMAIAKYHKASGKYTPQQAHNDYLELLASAGLIGVTLGIWFCAAFFLRARQRFKLADSYQRAASIGALAGILGVAIHSVADFGLHVTINAAVFSCLIVIATACDHENHKLRAIV